MKLTDDKKGTQSVHKLEGASLKSLKENIEKHA